MFATRSLAARLPGRAAVARLVLPADEALAQRLAWSWLRLAVASLTVAGLFVVPVIGGRLPLAQRLFEPGFFRVALVTHVTFSLNLWLMGFVAVLWTLAATRLARAPLLPLALLAAPLSASGALLLTVTAMAGLGSPVLADYVPVLAHPLFYGGLGLFFGGVGLPAAQYLVATLAARAPLPTPAAALRWAALTYLLALLSIALAWSRGTSDLPVLVWGAGHLFQVVNAAALLACWWWLLPAPPPRRGRLTLQVALPLLALPATLVPWLHALPGLLPPGEMSTVTWWGIGIPLVVGWVVVVDAWWRQGRPWEPALLLSLGFFAVGGAIALAGLESDVRVTAHYHAMVGAVTVAYMGFSYRLLGRLGGRLPARSLCHGQQLLYGLGIGLLVAGLFWAGLLGSPRKVFETFSGQLDLASPAGLVLVGSTLAALGGAAYVVGAGRLLLRPAVPMGTAPGPEEG